MWLCELRNTRAGGNSIRCCNAALVGRDLVLSNSFQDEDNVEENLSFLF